MQAQFRPISPSPPRKTTRTAPWPPVVDAVGRRPESPLAVDWAGWLAADFLAAPLTGLAAPVPAEPPRFLALPAFVASAGCFFFPGGLPLPLAFSERLAERPVRSESGNRLVHRVQPVQFRDDRPGLVVQSLGRGSMGETALPDRETESAAGSLGRDRVGELIG